MSESKYGGNGKLKLPKVAKIMVGVPSGNEWKAEFGMSLLHAVLGASQPVPGWVVEELKVWNAKGSILPQSRERLVRAALDGGYTHLLMVDSDMTFPAFTIGALLEDDKQVVACNCPTKMIPSSPTARQKGKEPKGELVYQQDHSAARVTQVWRVGTGLMMIRLDVFDKLEHPWFPIRWEDSLGDYVGEDWGFCEKLEEAGIPIYIDNALSDYIGHIGALVYDHGMVEVPGNSDEFVDETPSIIVP
jgi:hypothetical protein